MDAVVRGLCIYLVLLIVFRISGKRSLVQVTAFDFVLLLIVSETTQQALLGNDFSVTKAILLIVTLASIEIGLSLWKQRFPRLRHVLEGSPMLIVEDGQPLKDHMDKERVDESDVLSAARARQGLERMEQVKYALLEQNGEITVVPKQSQ